MNIYQSNANMKDLGWLHFHDESRVKKRQLVKDQQSYKFVSIGYLIYLTSSQRNLPDITAVFHAKPHSGF